MKFKNLNTKTGHRGLGSFVTKCLTTCILLLTLSLGAFAQQVTMDFVWVPSAGTSTTADFDVILKNTGAVPLTFNGIIIRSLAHNANTSILTGGVGTISWNSVAGTAPTSVASGNGWNNWPNISTNLGYTAGTRILNYSSSNTFFTNATAPTIPTGAGVNIGRFRMTVTGGTFVQGAQFGFAWATTAAVIAYVNGATTTTSLATAGTNKVVTASASQPLGPVVTGPTASVLSGSTSICNGATANLSVAVTGGTSPYTVTVTDGTSSFTATGTSPVSIPVTPSSTKTYSISSVTGGGTGTGNSGSATVTVTNPSDNVTTISQCGGSYTWANNGQTYTTSGVYTGTTTNCVTEKLDLTITPATTIGSVTQTQCGGTYTWPSNGQTYSTSGTYTNVVGCNTATLNLTITAPTTTGSVTQTQCGGTYTWPSNGQTYTTSGTYTNVVGCNTATLNLTITPTSDNVTTISQCGGSYTWANNGQTYTTSGVYTGTTTNCVTEKLNLTITAPSDNVTTISQCGGSYTWANNGQTYTTSGVYTGTTTNCVTEKLNLTINGGAMALTSAGNSVTGSSSASVTVNNSAALVNNSSCDYIATVTDGPSGSGAGSVTVGVVVAPSNTVSSINGQLYARRSFNINATNGEAGSITFYANQSDFDTYNANAGTLLQMNATNVKIAQVINGITGTVVPIATTASYNSALARYEITCNVPNLSGEYYLYTNPACALTMSTISVGTMTAVTSNSTYNVPLTWTAVSGAVSYDIRFRQVGTPTWTSFAATNLSRILVGLLSSTTYEFQGKVRCSSNTASGLWGTLGTFTTPAPLVVCTSPSSVSVSAITATSANFSWTAMSTPTTSYMLRYRAVGATTWQNCGVTTNSKAIGGLTSGTSYEAQVASYCSSINAYGAFTSSATFTTVSAPTCAAPTNFAYVSSTGSTATVSWTNSTGPTTYVVSVRVAGSTAAYLNYNGTSNPRHMGGLTPNTQYEAYLRGYCAATQQFTTSSPLIYFNTGALSKSPALVEYPEGVKPEVKMYPNPTSNELNIELLSENQSITSIKVMDMSGRVVKQTQSVTFEGVNTINVSLSELTAGMYTIQVVNNDKLMHIGRVTKN
jgi:hypothetical protein